MTYDFRRKAHKALYTMLAVVAAATPLYAAAPPKTAAFFHVVAATNTCGDSTVINHPLANGNPGAVIAVTYNAGATSGNALFVGRGPLAVFYDDAGACAVGRWIIYAIENTDHAQFAIGQRFNVIVATP
jgi:hypothetical protein